MMSLNGVLIYCHGDGIKTMDNSQRGALIESYAQIRDASIGWCDKICLYKNEKGVEDFFMFLAAAAAIYVILVIIRMFHFYNLDKTNEQVAKIHNTKLTMDDVTGKKSAPRPGRRSG